MSEAHKPHSIQRYDWRGEPYDDGAAVAWEDVRGLLEQLEAAERLAETYKADRDEYDALLGRKMAERDGLKEQVEAFRTEAEEQQSRWLEERDKRVELEEQLKASEKSWDKLSYKYDELHEQLEAYQRGITYIRDAARHRMTDGVSKRGWILAAWIEDACDRVDRGVSFPASEPKEDA